MSRCPSSDAMHCHVQSAKPASRAMQSPARKTDPFTRCAFVVVPSVTGRTTVTTTRMSCCTAVSIDCYPTTTSYSSRPSREDLEGPCKEDQLSCRNSSTCVPEWMVCDGDAHCPMADDEHNCTSCMNDAKLCAPLQTCIPKWLQCNGVSDCPDHSDEVVRDTKWQDMQQSPPLGLRLPLVFRLGSCSLHRFHHAMPSEVEHMRRPRGLPWRRGRG